MMEIEMPKEMSVDSLEDWQRLIDERLENDDGVRYTTQEILKYCLG